MLWKIAALVVAVFLFIIWCLFFSLLAAIIVGFLGACAYVIAERKGRDGEGWAVGIMLLPILFLLLLCLGKIEDIGERPVICPYCSEKIHRKARLCKHCGQAVTPIDEAMAMQKAAVTQAEQEENAEQQEGAEQPAEMKRIIRECPHCAEDILAKAKTCKHCGRDVEPVEA